MDDWREFWSWIAQWRARIARKRQRHMAALAPELPPAGVPAGKTVMPRARRNLPAGCRNRFGKEVE